jgi:hypothetical protein
MDNSRIARINQDLLDRTGVDFSRYRDPALIEAIGNAVTFPLYLGRSLTRPVGLLLLLAVLAFVLTDSGYLKTFIVFPGVLLVIANGVLLGLLLFIRRIRNDMKQVFTISGNLCVRALQDIDAARSRLRGRPSSFPSLLEIFQGINATVVLPVLIQTLQRRVPFMGKLAATLTERFFTLADARLAAAIQKRATAGPVAAGSTAAAEVAGWLDSTERAVQGIQANIAKVVDAVARVIALPFLTVFTIVLLMSGALVYGGYRLLG